MQYFRQCIYPDGQFTSMHFESKQLAEPTICFDRVACLSVNSMHYTKLMPMPTEQSIKATKHNHGRKLTIIIMFANLKQNLQISRKSMTASNLLLTADCRLKTGLHSDPSSIYRLLAAEAQNSTIHSNRKITRRGYLKTESQSPK